MVIRTPSSSASLKVTRYVSRVTSAPNDERQHVVRALAVTRQLVKRCACEYRVDRASEQGRAHSVTDQAQG